MHDPSIVERFWRFADTSGDCWQWTGYLNPKGYARLPVMRGGVRKYLRAYCIGWEIANDQPWPEGKMACHSCDNPSCVNPKHIRPGTAADNYADQLERGRLGAQAINMRKTHCIHGHPLSGDNLKIVNGKWRRCRECGRRAKRDFLERHSA